MTALADGMEQQRVEVFDSTIKMGEVHPTGRLAHPI
jgi:hypothetical protein